MGQKSRGRSRCSASACASYGTLSGCYREQSRVLGLVQFRRNSCREWACRGEATAGKLARADVLRAICSPSFLMSGSSVEERTASEEGARARREMRQAEGRERSWYVEGEGVYYHLTCEDIRRLSWMGRVAEADCPTASFRLLSSFVVMNLSHIIHEFSFGPYYPSISQPLDMSLEVSDQHFSIFQFVLPPLPFPLPSFFSPLSAPLIQSCLICCVDISWLSSQPDTSLRTGNRSTRINTPSRITFGTSIMGRESQVRLTHRNPSLLSLA